jgi:hypothetical protein
MTGTSSDVSFADAYVKGVQGFDALDAYDAALKNATVAPPGGDPFNPNIGRKGLVNSLFMGYTPDRVDEGVSWALEGDINDFGISNMAAKLATQVSGAGRQRRFAEEAEYFRSRATNYVNMFDPSIRFFQGRDEDGQWKSPPSQYDPREWGHDRDYTETDGWNFAFHAPQDGQGLANLYGGRDKLAQKLDGFFSTPETAKFVGSYGGVIHEMTEARDVRMGQWGFSNQVSHHIPYMYDYAGQPYKTQAKVREALRRMYVGSEIGQGYAGDEDNGETSAWFLFSALGFYPLQVGSERYAIGSPLFKQATLHLEGGHDLVVKAPGNSQENVYVQGLKLNGQPYDKAYLRHSDIAGGGTLEFDMGPEPSDWATGHDAAPPSITTGDEPAKPLRDQTGSERSTVSDGADALSDDDSRTVATVPGAVDFTLAEGAKDVTFYTLTSAPDAGSDPASWIVQGSNDGQSWTTLDDRSDQTFTWRSQTRPFKLKRPGSFSHYRILFAGGPVALGEVELLAREAADSSPVSASVSSPAGSAGETLPVTVDVSNYAETPATGNAAATVPAGWTVQPASQAFGPIAPGESATLTFQVAVPAGTAPGTYPVRINGTSDAGDFRAAGSVTVIGNKIDFAPDSEAEAPWLFETGGSQLDGAVDGGHARFADNANHFTYRFTLPADATGGKLSLEMGNQYLVRVSTDNQTWTKIAEETRAIRDLSNRGVSEYDLNTLRGGNSERTLYVRFDDSQPDDGWGPWLAHLTIDLDRP